MEDVKSFVSNELKSLHEERKNLEIHICACETVLETNKGCNERFALEHAIVRNEVDASQVMEFMESLICRQHDQWQILQLACLWSLTSNGIITKHYQQFRRLFLHAYGYEHLISLYNLQLLGLLFEQNNPPILKSLRPSNFNQLSKSLNLCPKAGGEKLSGSGYVFSDAYIPVACRLLELLASEGWQPALIQKAFGAEIPYFCSDPTVSKPDKRIRKALLVCFLGGVTYAEVAAIRRFSQNNDFRIIILTTHIINRETFIKNLTEII